MKTITICSIILFAICTPSFSGPLDLTIDDLCSSYPDKIKSLFSAISVNRPGLDKVKAALDSNSTVLACRELIAYYKKADTARWLRSTAAPVLSKAQLDKADKITDDYHWSLGFVGKVDRLPTGRKNWATFGPRNELEFNALLVRHTYMGDLVDAYLATKNPRYLSYLDNDLKDWILAASPNTRREYIPIWGAGLEPGLRIKAWAGVFFPLQDVNGFSDAARILMLSSIPQQCQYMIDLGSFKANHVVAEMYGLALAGLCWPEYKDSARWVKYAADNMIAQTEKQVYPDGVQKELSSHYHGVSCAYFEQFNDLFVKAGQKKIPQLQEVSFKMWDYIVYALNPQGYLPLNGDSYVERFKSQLLEKAREHKRDDWAYIASNGQKGTKPAKLSMVYPWAGHVFTRNSWHDQAHWAFFDIGPWGIAHQHYDKLNIEIWAYGRNLLCDSGILTYNGYYGTDPWRRYIIGSQGHNVILIDGVGQGSSPMEYSQPLPASSYFIGDNFTYASGTFSDGFKGIMNKGPIAGKASHTRTLLYLHDKFWLVLDEIKTDRPRSLTALWHYHPDCTVKTENLSTCSIDDDKGNLRIVPVSDLDWKLEIIKGRTEPDIQGWYSTNFDLKFPSSTAIYSADIKSDAAFAWLLIPAKGPVPPATAGITRVGIGSVIIDIKIAAESVRVTFIPGCVINVQWSSDR